MLSVLLGVSLVFLGCIGLLVVLVGRSKIVVRDPNLDDLKEKLELLSPDELNHVRDQVSVYVNRKSI